MDSFLRKTVEGKGDEDSHRYFVRFGKGGYDRRFLLSFNKTKKIKVKGSFEWVSDFARFVAELEDVKFSGMIMSKEEVPGMKGRKKGSSYVYEVKDVSLSDYANAYSYLLNAQGEGVKLKSKKSLPKPGKDAEKIDDGFTSMELDLKHWDKVKEAFFWDVNDGKKAVIEHTLAIDSIEMPQGETDPVKIRENAKRVGKIVRKIDLDGNKEEKIYEVSA